MKGCSKGHKMNKRKIRKRSNVEIVHLLSVCVYEREGEK